MKNINLWNEPSTDRDEIWSDCVEVIFEMYLNDFIVIRLLPNPSERIQLTVAWWLLMKVVSQFFNMLKFYNGASSKKRQKSKPSMFLKYA